MDMTPYRGVLGLPGVRSLTLVGLIARIPVTATGLTLTLHVTDSMKLGFTQAGLVGTAATLGTAVGAPLAGRFVDRHGLRPVLLVTTAAQLVFWLAAPALPYYALLVAGAVAGLLSLPVFTVIRQCLAAMVPAERRRPAFALDSMAVELSYMVGPAVAAAGVAALGSAWMLIAVGVGLVGSGVVLFLLDPPIKSDAEREEEQAAGGAPSRRSWLTPGLVTLLGAVSALTFVLTATELSLVATLTTAGATGLAGLVIGVWCLYSLIGGFVYGGLSREVSPLLLIGGLCALTAPLGLVGGGWWWLCLAILPSGLLCAPALSSSIDVVSRRVPAAARGEAMGLHSTALTLGVAIGNPVAGAVIDAYGPATAFAVTGLIGAAAVLLAVPFWRRHRTPAPLTPKAVPAEPGEAPREIEPRRGHPAPARSSSTAS